MSGIMKFKLSREDIGIIGSYSSFFALLLIATILSYRSILYFIIENFITGLPPHYNYPAIIISFLIFGSIFIAVPAIPVSFDIYDNAKNRKYKLMLMLIFLVLIYAVALFFQIVQVYYEIMENLVI